MVVKPQGKPLQIVLKTFTATREQKPNKKETNIPAQDSIRNKGKKMFDAGS